MKIAYVINSVEGGGAALPVPDVTGVMRKLGHHVEIFALARRDGKAIAPMERAGLRVHVREGSRTDHVSAFLWLKREMAAYRPDVIWTSLTRATLLGQVVGKFLRVPVVSWQHSARLKPMNARLLRLLRNRSALWIADSACVEQMTRRTLGIAPDRILRWPIFCAHEDFPQASPWKPGETLRIGTLGRLHPVKGYDTLCAAISLLHGKSTLPLFEVLIAGEGEERARLEAMIARDNLPVRLVGYVSDPPAFLAGLHLYTQPSLWEGFCLGAHEAMLARLPVVASRAGEMPFTITDKTGRIVPPENPEAFANALQELLEKPESLSSMGAEARRVVLERFGEAHFEQTGKNVMSRVEEIVGR
ncbi:glycosyltransferase [Acetobacter sp.]|uniref:glycosyltransferase n=1 Tax=Acetobacter sp. TaxID=440 RepID=UPI0039E9E9A8